MDQEGKIRVCGIDSSDFEQVSVAYIKSYFKDRRSISYDGETTGLQSRSASMLCFQLGDINNQFVIGVEKLQEFKEFLEDKELIAHNIKFDLTFLYKYGVFPNKVWDTYLAECVINCGKNMIKRNLAATAKRRLGVDLDKSIRDEIWKEGLSKRVIEYSAGDVKYLEKIKDSQCQDLLEHDLFIDMEVQNQFVLCLAYIEFCGFKLDEEKWKKKMERDLLAFEEARKACDMWMVNNHPELISAQLDLFSDSPTLGINWASSRQVVDLFKKLKIPVSVVVKGEEKESVEAKNIEKYTEKYEIVKLYLRFKEEEKVVTTYGQSFIKQINPNTGRLHTNFKQVLDTGRLSSGGSDKSSTDKKKAKLINFQNIPAEKETRSCFVAEPGNVIIEGDYVGQEAVVLANQSLDKNLLEFYDSGFADMHCFVASKMYPELNGLSVEEIKKNHKDKRQSAKTAGFAISYGGVGATIARNNNLSIEEGDAVYDAYFAAFPGLLKYFEAQKKKVLGLGYIQFNDIIKTKSFIDGYEEYLNLRQELNENFWDRWKRVKELKEEGQALDEWKEMKFKISRFFKIKGAIERKALNYIVQGTSATVTKIACIYFFRWIIKTNNLNKVLIVNTVHDSIVIECHKEISQAAEEALKESMVRSGDIFCKRVPLKVDITVGEFWQK